MAYIQPKFVLDELLDPLVRASADLCRLDERLARSPIQEGFVERTHFADACASLWVDGELVHAEELVLHDAGQDVRAPSHELTIAREVLRARRRLAQETGEWALTASGINALRRSEQGETVTIQQAILRTVENTRVPEDDGFDPLSREIAEMDALLARTEAVLRDTGLASPQAATRDPVVYDMDWNEDGRLAQWLDIVPHVQSRPAMLQAVLLLDAWNKLEVFQRQAWLGRLLVASSLKRAGFVSLLPGLNIGLKSIGREQRTHRKAEVRLGAFLRAIQISAEQGLKEHDRLLLAKQLLDRRLTGRRSSSRLPEVVKVVLSRPVVSTEMVAQAAQITQRAALRLIEELNLREVTGRGRFRAWGIL
ncbi:RHE_PE00001 family protein [Rhizobium helianthi]|uniref:RHE_PE00001 family protein n=1 Tax=Rhizobium helianthi TaxID=1132695 RepID=A0ABW4M1Z0_9HYPH